MKESLLLATQLIYDWATLVMLSLQLPAVRHIMAFLHGNGMILLLSSKSKHNVFLEVHNVNNKYEILWNFPFTT